MEVSQLNALVKARLKAIEKKNKADLAARKLEKEFKKL